MPQVPFLWVGLVAMPRVLCVAEKPSVARALARVLSNGREHREATCAPRNPVHVFDYEWRSRKVELAVTSVLGHLMELQFPRSHSSWWAVPAGSLLDLSVPVHRAPREASLVRMLQSQARRSQDLVLWLDCDREGEAISFEVIACCREVAPSLRVHRAQFASLEPAVLRRAMANPREPDARLAAAVTAREECDLRIGAAYTRFQTLLLRPRVGRLPGKGLVSYGPCQSPTLGFVVQRWLEKQSFVSQPWWTLGLSYTGPAAAAASPGALASLAPPGLQEEAPVTALFTWSRGHLFDHVATACLFVQACRSGPVARVIQAHQRPGSRWRPLPLTTVTLQKTAAIYLKLSAKRCLDLAETLYQKGFISYPRTETDAFPPDFDHRQTVEMLAGGRSGPTTNRQGQVSVAGYAAQLLRSGRLTPPRHGTHKDNAHPPIYPTRYASELEDQSLIQVYDLVVRHFLACVSPDAKFAATTIHAAVGHERFRSEGRRVLDNGFLKVYARYTKPLRDQVLPAALCAQGFTWRPHNFAIREGATKAPDLLTEPELITLMERHGIGTDATMAQHIETIQVRGYCAKQANRDFVPLQLGIALFEGYAAATLPLMRPHLRARMEAALQDIAEGWITRDAVIEATMERYHRAFEHLEANAGLLCEVLALRVPGPGARALAEGCLPRPMARRLEAVMPPPDPSVAPSGTARRARALPSANISCGPCPSCSRGTLRALPLEPTAATTDYRPPGIPRSARTWGVMCAGPGPCPGFTVPAHPAPQAPMDVDLGVGPTPGDAALQIPATRRVHILELPSWALSVAAHMPQHLCPYCSCPVLDVTVARPGVKPAPSGGRARARTSAPEPSPTRRLVVCPLCYRYPPLPAQQAVSSHNEGGTPCAPAIEEGSGDYLDQLIHGMPCSRCSHATCPLAKSQGPQPGRLSGGSQARQGPLPQPIMACTRCLAQGRNHRLAVKQIASPAAPDKTVWLMGCQGYPECRNTLWLASCVTDVAVTRWPCPKCRQRHSSLGALLAKVKATGFVLPDRVCLTPTCNALWSSHLGLRRYAKDFAALSRN